MFELPEPLAAMGAYAQFILWRVIERDGKQIKVPIDHRSGAVSNAHDPAIWLNVGAASAAADAAGCGVGFVFTESDPFYFLDIDGCLLHADDADPEPPEWSPLALELIAALPGAAVEVSQSGRGLHIFGTCHAPPPHRKKNTQLHIELYTSGRFVALTGDRAVGSAHTDNTDSLTKVIDTYFSPSAADANTDTDEPLTANPVAGYRGPADDAELLGLALASVSAGSVFGGRASFADLWHADESRLSVAYPPNDPALSVYDQSQADAALAQHLAFWTGGHGERIRRMMLQSALVRDKWERAKYVDDTIRRACALQTEYYATAATTIADACGAGKLRATSDAQRTFAERVREAALASATDEERAALCAARGAQTNASFWLNNQALTATELAAKLQRLEAAPKVAALEPSRVSGLQYLTADLQLDYFAGCVYIQDAHRVLVPDGSLLKPDQFNATYGGYSFQMDDSNSRETRKAWEAFTESQIIRWPKANGLCFRPDLEAGALVQQEGRVNVNTYVHVDIDAVAGDPSPFVAHLHKVLPVAHDRDILMAYMAACVQHKGVKFQWAPLLQGTEGNGKTLFTRCVAYAVGERYSHMPLPNELNEKFNAWLFDKLFIGIEDVYVPEHKSEVIEILKPMLTNPRMAMRAMQRDQVMRENYANFMLNSNHKDAIRKTRNDRRFAVFYTAQQTSDDLVRDGMGGAYFPELYTWLRGGGYAIVAHYLAHYPIPDALNPAIGCHRAPETSSTAEAVATGLGSVEQEIMEAVSEGRVGFCGGWISSVALDTLLHVRGMGRRVPPNKRRDMIRSLGYDWHPSLHEGRTNAPTSLDGGKKPRLYVRNGHLAINVASPSEVVRMYEDAQSQGHADGPFQSVTEVKV